MKNERKRPLEGAKPPPAKRRELDTNSTTRTSLFCSNCSKDISDGPYIKCAECRDVDLCLECFASAAELRAHKPTHDYSVIAGNSMPVFDEDWSATEESALLDAIEMYGFGNWPDIAEHVKTKSAKECEIHYQEVYLAPPTAPLPDTSATRPLLRTAASARAEVQKAKALVAQRAQQLASAPAHVLGPECAGYMPLRGDFEVEYDNDAEVPVKDMVFADEDTPLEKDIKCAVFDMYNRRLERRIRRRQMVAEHSLVELKKLQAIERKASKEEREARDQLRPFMQLQSAEKHQKMVQGLANEQILRARIRQLREWRENGVTTLVGGEIYEQEKKKREGDKQQRKSAALSLSANRRLASFQRRREEDINALKGGRKPATPLDLNGLPGIELLGPGESELCSVVRLQPKQYLGIKAMLLKEAEKVGTLRLAQARVLVRIDVNKTRKIYDFMVNAGWIKQP